MTASSGLLLVKKWVIFGSLDQFPEVSAFSTPVVVLWRQSSLSLSQDESCRANLKTQQPSALKAVHRIYSVSFFIWLIGTIVPKTSDILKLH